MKKKTALLILISTLLFIHCKNGRKAIVENQKDANKQCCINCEHFKSFIKEFWESDSLGVFTIDQHFVDVFEKHKKCFETATKGQIEELFGRPSNEEYKTSDIYFYNLSKGCITFSGECRRLSFQFDTSGMIQYLPIIYSEPRH